MERFELRELSKWLHARIRDLSLRFWTWRDKLQLHPKWGAYELLVLGTALIWGFVMVWLPLAVMEGGWLLELLEVDPYKGLAVCGAAFGVSAWIANGVEPILDYFKKQRDQADPQRQ